MEEFQEFQEFCLNTQAEEWFKLEELQPLILASGWLLWLSGIVTWASLTWPRLSLQPSWIWLFTLFPTPCNSTKTQLEESVSGESSLRFPTRWQHFVEVALSFPPLLLCQDHQFLREVWFLTKLQILSDAFLNCTNFFHQQLFLEYLLWFKQLLDSPKSVYLCLKITDKNTAVIFFSNPNWCFFWFVFIWVYYVLYIYMYICKLRTGLSFLIWWILVKISLS